MFARADGRLAPNRVKRALANANHAPMKVEANQLVASPPDTSHASYLAFAIAVLGGLLGIVGSGIEHFVIVVLIEIWLAPPLKPQENFGQFGFLTLYVSFFGGLYGLSMALIPSIQFGGWLPVFLLISAVAASVEPMDYTSTAGCALIVIAVLVIPIAAATSLATAARETESDDRC